MKVNNIVNGVTALQKLNNLDLPISLAFKIKKNLDECGSVLTLFNEKRNAIQNSLDLKDGDMLPPESVEAIERYLEEEIDINISKISIKQLIEGEAKTLCW